METILFALPNNETIGKKLSERTGLPLGKSEIRQFPDGETYVRIDSDVRDKRVVLVCTLDRPDEKLLPLYFLSKTTRDLGANCTCLVAPYLAYMRQDKRFRSGEGITSEYFAALLSSFADSLITIDPHLHRRSSLSEIYSIPTTVSHASAHISNWIKENVGQPVLVGPDKESEQWVSEVADNAGVPHIILEKVRHGDRDVEISVPDIKKHKHRTPVLVDDIISTGRTMIETISHLKNTGMRPPVCVGVHAIFVGDANEDLINAGAERVVTCNTVVHQSNEIDVSDLLTGFVK
ncbi:MAG TPA: ribose-phosphate pyrophosphokinase [Thermodesulfobacteriota bacterium]|nr:ribose-phosphate pyrophosphokinase [Thermodesulfobacteriota bacterium]